MHRRAPVKGATLKRATVGKAGTRARPKGKSRAASRARARPRSGVMPVALLLVLAVAAIAGWDPISKWAFDTLNRTAPGQPVAMQFVLCKNTQNRDTCIVDGDTINYRGEVIRIADIDAPEVFHYACASEKALGEKATNRMLALVNAGPFAINRYYRETDIYGRKLRILTRDGHSLGMTLVGEGLAHEWDGSRRPWC